jgi:hypothetical protein
MEEKNNKITTDQLFRQSFAELEQTPSPSVWNKVEKELDQDGRKRPGAWWWFGIGLVLFCVCAGGWLLWSQTDWQQNQVAKTEQKKESKKTELAKPIPASAAEKGTSTDIKKSGEGDHGKDGDALPIAEKENQGKEEQNSVASAGPGVTPSSRTGASTPASNSGSETTPGVTSANGKKNNENKAVSSGGNNSNGNHLPVSDVNTSPSKTKQPGAKQATTHSETSSQEVSAKTNQPEVKQIPSSASTPAISQTASAKKNQQDNKQTPGGLKGTEAAVTATGNKEQTETGNGNQEKKAEIKKDDGSVAGKDISPVKDPSVASSPEKSNAGKDAKTAADSIQIAKTKDSLAVKNTPPVAPPAQPDSLKEARKVGALLICLSGYGSPELYKNMIQSNSGPFLVKSEKSNPRVFGGLRISLCFPDKLEVSIGCAYSEINQEFQHQPVSFPKSISQPFVFNSSLGDMSVPASTMLSSYSMLAPVTQFHFNYQYSQTVQYLNVPVLARYNMTFGRFTNYISLGVNFQYLTSQHSTLELLKENETDRLEYNDLDIRKLNIGAMFNLGSDFRINKRFSVFLEPNMRYNLEPVTNHTVVQSSALYIGGACGVRIKL